MSQPVSTVDITPIPVRYRWLKRISVGCVVLLVALVLLRLWWGRVADRRLQAEIDRIIAAGEPLFPEDFDSPSVPDENNAVFLFEQAMAPWANSGPATLEPLVGIDPGPEYWADAEGVIKANANALTLIRKIRSMPGVDWGIRVKSPVNVLMPSLANQRQMARFVCGTARYRHHTARDDETVETLRDALAIGAVIEKHPALIANLVARAVRSVVGSTIEILAPSLRIVSAKSSASAAGTPANRAQIQALITDLLDAGPSREAFVRAMHFERMSYLNTVQLIASGRLSLTAMTPGAPALTPGANGILVWPIRPLFVLDGVRMIQRDTRLVDAARQPTWPAALARLPREPIDTTGLRTITRGMSRAISASYHRVVQIRFEGLARDRMAAIALATRMYELDHGRRPQTLDALVPEYLARVPDDPFGTNGRPISYRPDADPPVLYSIGYDGKDDRGAFSLESGRIDHSVKDIPFFLNGNRPRQAPPGANPTPATTPSPQTDDDDSDKAEDERNAEQRGDGQPEP